MLRGQLKRKQRDLAAGKVVAVYTAPSRPYKRRKQAFIPGVDRTGGFYGRFSGERRGGELKFHDVDLDDAVIATGGTVTPSINLIAQGVTESQRVGRKCTLRSINWKFRVALNQIDAAGTSSTGDSCRVILFLDKQCNGATATVINVLESANYQSFRNLANSGRFMILQDKLVTINYNTLASDNAGVVSQSPILQNYTFYKKCNIPIEYDNTTGAITEIRSNNLGVLLISEQGTGGFQSKFRLRFSDN